MASGISWLTRFPAQSNPSKGVVCVAKFAKKKVRPNVVAPVKTTKLRMATYEGHLGYERDAKSELFLLAVTNMVGENTFYESKGDRDNRFAGLAQDVTRMDPEWVRGFVPYLRDTMQMRSASVVLAAHYVAAGGPNGRSVVDSALQRADEPAEMLAFWAQEYGRNFPQPIKRGVADAVLRLYNERSALKWDGQGKAWRMGDVIELVHPKPMFAWQSDLFRWLLDTRHNRADVTIPESLAMITARAALEAQPVENRRGLLKADYLFERAGMTWESLSGWLQGPMDAEAWETVMPNMGYMALLRNLRNFEQAGVSDHALDEVASDLANEAAVKRSRQFPIRFYSAYKQVPSERFSFPLEQALGHSLKNVPKLKGNTLVMIDVSSSMKNAYSQRGTVNFWETAAVFGVALAKRQKRARCFIYNTNVKEVSLDKPIMRTVEAIGGAVTGGTATFQMLARCLQQDTFDRVVVLTDEQAHPGHVPTLDIPLYIFNLAGYRTAQQAQGEKGVYAFGGLTDAGFRMIAAIDEARTREVWPWETKSMSEATA